MCVLRYPTTRAVLERNDCGTPLSITMFFVCERLHRMTSKLRPPVRFRSDDVPQLQSKLPASSSARRTELSTSCTRMS